MSIDALTGTFCLNCSIDLLWRYGDIPGALDGLPPRSETQGHSITELLCEYHKWLFANMPLLLLEPHPLSGKPPVLMMRGGFPRPMHQATTEMSQDELLDLLQRMEMGLRLVHAEYLRTRLFEVICEQPTVMLPTAHELAENARLHAAIYDYLYPKKRGMEPSMSDLMEIEYDDGSNIP